MPTNPADFRDWMLERQERIEAVLASLLPAAETAPRRLHEAMRYAVLGGGKRVRPLLAFAAGDVAGAQAQRVEIVAAAVEIVHAYSLVHDDLPCMDDDVLRRGKPTCHVEFDEATALLAGDSLQALAFQWLAEHRLADEPAAQVEMIRLLAAASGSHGMAGGQAIDLGSVGRNLTLPELEFMHILKTGALIRGSVAIAARCGRLEPAALGRLDHFAKCVGLAFQVVDDVLDASASTATLGKTAGKDAIGNKPTYVSVLGIDSARTMARELAAEALAALEGFGDSARRLRDLASFIVDREF